MGVQTRPASVVFHTPPLFTPTKKTFGWSGMPAAPTVRPPRNGPMQRQRISEKSRWSTGAAEARGPAARANAAAANAEPVQRIRRDVIGPPEGSRQSSSSAFGLSPFERRAVRHAGKEKRGLAAAFGSFPCCRLTGAGLSVLGRGRRDPGRPECPGRSAGPDGPPLPVLPRAPSPSPARAPPSREPACGRA